MGRGYDLLRIIEKLQCPKGYQGCRIRPHPSQSGIFYAERYTTNQTRARKSWKPLLSETKEVRTFSTPEEAEQALIEARGEPFTDRRPFYIQLQLGTPEDQLWRGLILRAEQDMPGSLEAMIEDAATRLTTAMRELRECKGQKRANQLYEIVIGQSHRLMQLAQYTNQEARRSQWLRVDQNIN